MNRKKRQSGSYTREQRRRIKLMAYAISAALLVIWGVGLVLILAGGIA